MKKLYALFLLVPLLAACVESESVGDPEEGEEEERPLLGFTALEVSEKLTSDAQAVTVTRTYHYDAADRLTDYVTRQTTEGAGAIELENTTTVTYADGAAEVTDAAGNTLMPLSMRKSRRASTTCRVCRRRWATPPVLIPKSVWIMVLPVR